MVLEIFYSELTMEMIYGFGFLFVTLFVATLSDLIKMRIERKFMYMWLGFTILIFVHEFLVGIEWLKWIIMLGLGLLSWRGTGRIFRLARADVLAISAVCSLLTIPQILLFYGLLIVVNKVFLLPVRLLRKTRYPFIPVIWISLTLMIIFLGVFSWNLLELFSRFPLI